ncbi:hypothetical protein SAMN05216302_101346 [Nitrosomonas aestuarii]|uniref:Uncharacterized protein n=1 Tax=Nitrosomonas aestuarii TaxID=52441 RepID=A0A1I4BUP9_9PROT|nr:hypothetical protein SAMN05216302_101346 [Nitrosomonas aestuarii]
MGIERLKSLKNEALEKKKAVNIDGIVHFRLMIPLFIKTEACNVAPTNIIRKTISVSHWV